MWLAKTLKDSIPTEQQALLHLCRACGRSTNPDMLDDVSALPEAVRGVGINFACDACREKWIRLGKIDRVTYVTLLGAPADHQVMVRQVMVARGEQQVP